MQSGYSNNTSLAPDFVMWTNVGMDFILQEHVVALLSDNQLERLLTPHITLLCAITPSLGLIHSKIIIGGAKQGDFDGFISELFQLNFGAALDISEGVTKQYIILDNAPCDRGVESIPTNTELIRLPPYSCELNPIEFSFNTVKAFIKRKLSEHGPVTPTEEQTLVAARTQFFVNCCPKALALITATTTLNSFYHVLTVMPEKQ